MKQQMIGWLWHQLNHMQNICTWLQSDNRISQILQASTASKSVGCFFCFRIIFHS